MTQIQRTALNTKTLITAREEISSGPRKLRRSISASACRASLLAAALVMAGCSSYNKDHVIVGSTPTDYRTKHPIVVSESDVVKDLAISSNVAKLSLRDRNVIRDFAFGFRRSGGRYVQIILPVGSPNARTTKRLSRAMIAELREVGVRSEQISLASYDASGHGDAAAVRLSYRAMTAAVASECGVWDGDLGSSPENKNYGNYGCATQNNLAAMVANPADLLGPRGRSDIDATRRDNVIADWRTNGPGAADGS